MQTVIPENIADLSNEEVANIEAELIAEFDALIDAESSDVAVMTEIADGIEAIRAEQVARAEAEAKTAEAVAALAERVHIAEAEVSAESDPEGDDDAEEAEATVEVAEETPTITEVVQAEATEQERELVTASADKTPKAPSASAVARRSSTPQVAEAQPEVVITAAADVPGYAGGAHLDKMGIAKAMHAKARTLSNGSGYVPVASINLPIEHKLGADLSYNMDVLDRATAPEALTAAGWCAPSNNLYTLFGIDAADGLIDLPTVQITRGGLNVPNFVGLDYLTMLEQDGAWSWTEADQGNVESSKPCLYVPCPDFTDYRLVAEGICLTNGNLTDRAFPELTQRYIELLLNTHLHRVSYRIIEQIANSAVGINMTPIAATSSAGRLFSAIDLSVASYRSKYRMSVNSVLEVVLPLWTREMLRADLANRAGVALTNVSDAQIDEHFAVRKVRPQFVHDYQPIARPNLPYNIALPAFPSDVQFLIYPAGGYVRGDGGTIDLGVVRDSVLNATNDYTAAWTEQMYLVAQLGPDAHQVNVQLAEGGFTGCCPTESPAI